MIQMMRQQFPQYSDLDDDQLVDQVHQDHYSDMPRDEFDRCCGMRPTHTDLAGAAVTGGDSLDLQELDPTVKPVVKMTLQELPQHMERLAGKPAVIIDGTVYIIDSAAIDPVYAMAAIMEGDDSEILGYPQPGESDAAVTKQGEVVTDVPAMRQHAEAGNLIWAASGEPEELKQKAAGVAAAVSNHHHREKK